jgi:FKBP-type peptidyl-prolyl cis-trans isomerase FkpA
MISDFLRGHRMTFRSTILALICAAAASMAYAADQAAPAGSAAPAEAAPQVTKIDNVVGTGDTAMPGRTVVVHYTGWFYKPLAPNQRGRKFDSSLDNGQPFSFQVGARQVIKGWDQGVVGMKVGGKRTLIIPSALGYGSRGAGGGAIPPDSDLIFDIELLQVK